MNKLLTFFLLCLLISSCKKQPATSGVFEKGAHHMEWTPLNFDYLVMKSKVSFKTKDNSTNFTANIRIKKDSIIWLSATPGMGIEVLRAIVTNDSVKVINRLENKYDTYSLTYIKETLGIELSYNSLQNLIVGDVLLTLTANDQVVTSDDNWQLKQQHQGLDVTSVISRLQKKLTLTEAKNQDDKYLLSTYSNFTTSDSVLFHQEQQVLMRNGRDTSFIDVAHQKIEFPKKSVAFPFNVPKRFER